MFKQPCTPFQTARSRNQRVIDKDTIQVFARLRPTSHDTCIKVLSSQTLSTIAPDTANQRLANRETHHTFREIFPSDTTQSAVFETVAEPLVRGVIDGKNGLLFTYGVTGSGKTYTMSGNKQNAGIMPRSIKYLFKTIARVQADRFIFKSDKLNGFDIQSPVHAKIDRFEFDRKRRIGHLKPATSDSSIASVSDSELPNASFVHDQNMYSVFITYVEIYNNAVYDLLEETGGKTLQSKMIREDITHNMFVHGVTEIEVKTAQEALQLYVKGQKRKRVAYTDLNAESSRSHSNFTIRVVQAPIEMQSQERNDRSRILISQLSLVDLAGSERVGRTHNTGVRLKETSKINNSLLNLRVCLEALRENQNSSHTRMIPYRDSKLTHLFKSFFEGEGFVRMIVCINPIVQDYEESLQVLKFAEVSQKIQIQTPLRSDHTGSARRRKRAIVMTDIVHTDTEPDYLTKYGRYGASGDEVPISTQDPKNLAQFRILATYLNDRLKQREIALAEANLRVRSFRTNLYRMESQQTMGEVEVNVMRNQLSNTQVHLEESLKSLAKVEKEKIQLKSAVANKNERLYSLQVELNEKQMQINQLLHEKEQQRNNFESQAEERKRKIENTLREQRNLKSQLKQKDNKIRQIQKIFKNEITTENDETNGSGRPQHKVSGPYSGTIGIGTQTQISCQAPSTIASQLTPAYRPATIKRRSRSVGNEKWLEHRVGMATGTGTILQPKMNKAKTLTKLTDHKDVTKSKVSKYCLVSQEADTDGEIETRFLKGDIVQTTGGGAQVIFNEVELLKQESPSSRIRRQLNICADDLTERCSVGIEGKKP